MERMKGLGRYQKGILLLLITMAVVFCAVYVWVTGQTGFLYMDQILVPTERNGTTVYAGVIDGEEAEFTVTRDNSVTFRHGETVYGPYTVAEDPDAVPADEPMSERMTGIVIRDGDEVLFRGGWDRTQADSSMLWLYDENGWYSGVTITASWSDGTVVDGNGNIVDPMEPSIGTVLRLLQGPILTNKGHWIIWFLGVFLSVMTAVSILFADELFRWNLSFRIHGADYAEPSDWEIAQRYIGWTVMTVMTFVLYIIGLQ